MERNEKKRNWTEHNRYFIETVRNGKEQIGKEHILYFRRNGTERFQKKWNGTEHL